MKYLLTFIFISLLWTGHDVIVENEIHKEHCKLMTERYLEAEKYQVMVKTGTIMSEDGNNMILLVEKIK